MPLAQARLPDLGLPDQPVRATVWLASCGSFVERGEPILEVAAGSVAVDIPAPASGVLAEQLVAVDQPLATGRPVATIDPDG